jgi:hypothetical protein
LLAIFYLTAFHVTRPLILQDHFIHFEPVSVNAVAIILKDPPFSTLRAAQKNRFGFWCIRIYTPLNTLPDAGCTVL